LSIMVEWETGLFWLVATIFAALAGAPADTQHARFAPPADRLTETATPAAPARRAAPDYWITGPPAALSCLSA
jgi:hypothetical protein